MALLTLNEDKDCSPDDGNEVKGQVHKISIVELGQPIRKKSQSTIPNKCLWSKFLENSSVFCAHPCRMLGFRGYSRPVQLNLFPSEGEPEPW